MGQLTDTEAQLRGIRSEQRFFEAATVQLPETPYWLVAIEKAHVELDLRGVDAIAYIRYPGEQHVERVPIQIKSSWDGHRRYVERHAAHGAEMVLTIVMLDTRTDLEVRKILYAELRKIRQNNIRYNQYFDALVSTRLSEGAERVFQRLLRARMRVPYVEKNRPVGLPRPHRARPLARIVLRARNIARKLFRSK